jgi:hypothetical protein
MIIICTMLNIYTVKQKSLGDRFFLCTIIQNQVQDFFFNILANVLLTRQLTTLCTFI